MSLKDVLDAYTSEFQLRYAGRYYGKYRALVRDNQDPSGLGRIKVQVPVLFGGATSAWCWPSMPFGGNSADSPHGAVFIPDVGDMVWVELEEGNTQKPPVYTSGMWSTESVPDHARAFPDDADSNPVKGAPQGVIPESNFDASETGKVRVIQMPSGSRLEFDETEGSERVQLFHKSGAHIEILSDGTAHVAALENLKLQATNGILQVFANAAEQITQGLDIRTVGGDSQNSVGGSRSMDIVGDYTLSMSTHAFASTGDVTRDIGGAVVETILGKEKRTIASISSTMVGTDWFVQAAGGVSIVAQNTVTNGGIPTDLGAELTAMNSRAVVQSTDATGLATVARLELNGTPGAASLSATVANILAAPLLYIGPTVSEVTVPTRPGVYADTLIAALTAIVTAFDTHVHISAAPGAPTVIPTVPMSTTVTPLIAPVANPFVLQQ